MKFSHSTGKVSVMTSGKNGNMNVFIYGRPSAGGKFHGSKKKHKRKLRGK